jgi:hypothetical protein
MIGTLDLSVQALEHSRESFQVPSIGSWNYVDILGSPNVAVLANRDPTDQQELDYALHQLLEDRLDIELRHRAGACRHRPAGT